MIVGSFFCVFFYFCAVFAETIFAAKRFHRLLFLKSDLHAREYAFERGIGGSHIGIVSDLWFAQYVDG